MIDQWRRLCLYGAIGLSVLFILFPPFNVNGGPAEYGFILQAPPSARQAYTAMSAFGGQQGRDMAGDMVHYAIDIPRLLLQLAIVWAIYLALRRTVMKRASI